MIHPELLNNLGVLRLEAAIVHQYDKTDKFKKDSEKSLNVFEEALRNTEILRKKESQKEESKMQIDSKDEGNTYDALRISIKFNIGYWYEMNDKLA